MESTKNLLDEYTQVRRVLARIAIANDEIDERERIVIASGIGGASNLSGEQLKILLDDATVKPDVTSLVSKITEPIFLKQLMVDLSALALMKGDWHESEIDVLKCAVMGMKASEENRSKFLEALELLLSVSQTM